nr:MFS transporter [Gordonia araii]
MFGAQVVGLAGNGLTTVALGLLAYRLAGPDAAAVLGTALAIKMIAYVTIAPVAGGYVDRFNRRRLLVVLDTVRAGTVAMLPFVDQVWQVYVLLALTQSASAAFTPTFQATLPDLLPDEGQYTRALSYSQLASTLETLLSPVLAALLVTVVDFHWLFACTSAAFVISGLLVVTSGIPDAPTISRGGAVDRISAGLRIFAATPRLRGVLGLDVAVAGAGSIVMVNTVNLVQQDLGRTEADVAWLLAANGAGVFLVAFAVPRLLDRYGDRTVMLVGAGVLAAASAGILAQTVALSGDWRWPVLLILWALVGGGTGAVLTPVGNVLRRSSRPEDRPALFAAQFSLSHAAWLVAYPIAGWGATIAGYGPTWAVLAALVLAGFATAVHSWRRDDPDRLPHFHPTTDTPEPGHLVGATAVTGGYVHTHAFVIDRDHRRWPR